MKKRLKKYIFIFLSIGLLLAGCSGVMGATSWPGLSADNGITYLAYSQGIYAVDANNGNLAWSYPEKPNARIQFFSEPAFLNGLVIVGDFANTLYGLEKDTGREEWKFEDAKGRWIAPPLIVNDTVYAPCADNNLYALDQNGNLLWSFKTDGALWSQPVSNNGTIFQPSMDHNLYAINAENGRQLWSTDLGGAVNASAVYHESGLVAVGTIAQEVVALNAESGNIVWRTDTEGGIWSKPVIREDIMYVGDLTGNVYSIDLIDGSINWTTQLDSAVIGSGALTPDGIVFNSEAGEIVMINFDGGVIWSKNLEAELFGTPHYTADLVIVALTKAGHLLAAFDLNGNEQWTFSPPK